MIRLKPQRRLRVSNGAALLAAMVLLASSYFALSGDDPDQQAHSMQSTASLSQDDSTGVNESSARRKPSISRLLFGNN
jgi:hypothetical protein